MSMKGKMKEQKKKKKKVQTLPTQKRRAVWPENVMPKLPFPLTQMIRGMKYSRKDSPLTFGHVVKTWRDSSRQCSRVGKHEGPWLESSFPLNSCAQDRKYSYGYPIDGSSTCAIFTTNPFFVDVCMNLEFTGLSHPAFLSYEPLPWRGVYVPPVWMKHDCEIIDPNAPSNFKSAYMQFTNTISLGSKIYASSLQGTLAVIEVISSKPVVTLLRKSRAVPSIRTKHFKEYMIRYNDKIFLVLLICQKTIDVVGSVEVFRLDFKSLLWVKTDNLADITIFVGPISFIVGNGMVEKVGCRRNSVYFPQGNDEGWWVFDMESHSISDGTKSFREELP